MTETKKETKLTKEQETGIIFKSMTKNESGILNPTPPYKLRNDCQVGQWKRGEDDFKGSTIEISLIGAKHFYGKLGQSLASWVQLWFIAAPSETKIPRNTVCCTYIKTRSLDDLSGKLIELTTEEKDPGQFIFTGSFEKHSGTMGNYYSVKWEARDRTEDEKSQLTMIRDFLWNETPIFKDTSLPDTMICTEGMTEEEIENLDETIEAIEKQEKAKMLEAGK